MVLIELCTYGDCRSKLISIGQHGEADQNQWSAWVPITFQPFTQSYGIGGRPYTKQCQNMNGFVGTTGLMTTRNIGSFAFDALAFLNEARQCSVDNNVLRGSNQPTAGADVYPAPDLSSLTPDHQMINNVPCLYNTPVCDAKDQTFLDGCTTYRQSISDQMYQYQSGYHGPKFDTDQCTEREMLWYCAMGVGIAKNQTTEADFAFNYASEFGAAFSYHWNSLQDQSPACFVENSP